MASVACIPARLSEREKVKKVQYMLNAVPNTFMLPVLIHLARWELTSPTDPPQLSTTVTRDPLPVALEMSSCLDVTHLVGRAL